MGKILFLANLVPYPTDNGGKIFTKSVLKSLSTKNSIDLVCFYENENIEEARNCLQMYCNSITFIRTKITTRQNMKSMIFKAFLSLFSSKPLAVLKFQNRMMKNIIKSLLKKQKYDYVFYNILAMYNYSSFIKQLNDNITHVLYEQNCEAIIYKRMIKETSGLKRVFVRIEKNKLQKFEQNAISKVDKLILLSQEDKNALGVNRECSIIPIGVDSNVIQKKCSFSPEKIRLLFIGTMSWTPNSEGIVWFIENVIPKCDENKVFLSVVGKNPSEEIVRLAKVHKNVKLLGYVDNLDTVFEDNDVLVVPLFIGSGQRVKILEAFSRAFPVITTSIGVEGLKHKDGENVLIANDSDSFVNIITKCCSFEILSKIGMNGRKIFMEEYSQEIVTTRILDVFNK